MEESATLITSIQTSMNTWFTPTVLFIFLNLMIATILFTSNLPNKQQPPNDKHVQNDTVQSKLARSPSILHRLKSFTFYPHRSQDEPSLVPNHHEQQQQEDALEIAATQYVFSHPFTHEQDLQPIPTTLKRFDFGPTRIEKEAPLVNEESFTHQDLQHLSANPKRFNFDPTRFDFDPIHIEKCTPPVDEETFTDQDSQPVSANLKRFDFDPTRMEKESPPEFDADFVETHDEETDNFDSLDEVYSKITGVHVNRTMSDTLPASGEVPVKLPAKMKKSASVKSAFAHFEEDKIVEARRPATVRERRAAEDDDVEVDAKADDFINKFKHQLKLQRLDSIVRYKDMVNRGGGK
ncbi:hypothetical protein HanPI659440_Chr07g0256031 [Helianthus annuus]|nr:hypothetical protein HanPI659440_Chr07g0256031 [Helianthus annuus]